MLASLSKWIILILLIGVVIFVIKAGMKIFHIIIMILVLSFAWFTFFTDIGAARLSIVFKGHPIIAYTAKLEKQESISNDEVTYYKSDKEIIFDNEKVEYVKCYKKWIIRIPSVEE